MNLKNVLKRVSVCLTLLMLFQFSVTNIIPASAATTPSVKYAVAGDTKVGGTFTITVNLDNVSSLYGASIDLLYDTKLIEVTSVKKGNIFDGTNASENVKNLKPGQVEFAMTMTGESNGISKSGSFAVITAKVLKAGTVNIKTTNSADLSLTGSTARVKLANPSSATINYTATNSKITLTDKTTGTSDWEKHWAAPQIREAMDKGWVNKTDTFRPDASITRAEFIKIVNNAFGYTTMTAENFSDVNPGDWYYYEVRKALQAGYITDKNSKFRPNDPITRQEVASIVTTIKANKDWNLDKIKTYIDYNQVAEWARPSVEGAIEAGYMGAGSKTFRPTANITRAESIVTLTRVVK